ncbi:MAG: hypothetical protein M3168_06735 [Actinomycetota bacterium]|nr:hypothetical protein [Actinomycetota bacterium]
MEEYEEGGSTDTIYEGWASQDPEFDRRKDLTIEGALRNAYENAKEAGATPPYVVVDIEVHGDNPISDYRVRMSPGGGG